MPKPKMDPLPITAFHILLALSGEELHGYAIMRRVEEHSSGKVRLGPATLYGSIQNLLEVGFIEELESTPADGDARRRYYRLTNAGKKAATEEADRLAMALRLARAKKVFRGAHV
jgi:DNA-binding PadR family transcriptional regulator